MNEKNNVDKASSNEMSDSMELLNSSNVGLTSAASTASSHTKRIKDLESLIEKKFNSIKQENDSINTKLRSKSSVDENDESDVDTNNSMESQNEKQEFDDYDFEDEDEQEFKINNITKKCDESELKSLNDYIRSNTNFKFERLDKYDNDQETIELDYDNDYNQSELENEENIRRIIQLCKQKYPDLKYKITKCVKTIFKEKFRVAYKKTEEKIKSNKTKSSPHAVNNLFKQQQQPQSEYKMNKSSESNQIKSSSSPSSLTPLANTSSSSSPNLKHSINNHINNDLKAKKIKTANGSDSKNEDFKSLHSNKSSDNLKSATTSLLSSTSSSTSSSPLPFDNKFLNSSLFNPSSSAPLLGSQLMASSSSASSNPLASPSIPPFDPEFMRIAAAAAAANPLFRFPDFNALNNPYFSSLTNLFRSSPNTASPLSQFGLTPPPPPFSSSITPSTTTSSSSSNQSIQMPVNSTSSSSNFSNSKSLISPTSKNNGHFFSNHSSSSSHHNFNDHDKPNKHSSNSNSIHKNGDSTNKLTNGSNVSGSSLSSYLLSSSKPKLSSKFSKLSSADVQTVKNLANGYRESASFLTRAAEELEQLLSESNDNESSK